MELAVLITAVALLVGAVAVPLGQEGRMSLSRALATLGQAAAAL
jgi:hypothetical protein